MSRTTNTVHVRGLRKSSLLRVIDVYLDRRRLVRVPDEERDRVERTVADLTRVAIRRVGRWSTIALDHEEDIDAWGSGLSGLLARSVLTIWTWDGEASVSATRWKHGRPRARLELLREAYRGKDGEARAPARVLRPWIDRDKRAAALRDGIPLVAPARTGNAELDAILASIRDDEPDDPLFPDHVFVDLDTSVAGIAAAIGLRDPMLDPYVVEPPDEELLYRPRPRA